jgi:SAM-dependent methyltransferase
MGGPVDECCPPNDSAGLNPSSHWSEMPRSTYALDNAVQGAGTMLDWLAQVLDENTKPILKPLIQSGARCLELGAGTGTVARFMCETAGPMSAVIATDINTKHVRPHPGVQIVKHDLLNDPLTFAVKEFDVIHARLLFAHLQTRDSLLPELVRLLRPGGYLVIEEWGGPGVGRVLDSPFPRTAELYAHYQDVLIKAFQDAENDPTWAPRVHAAMVKAGLEDVRTTTRATSWSGKTAGCRLPTTVSTQLELKLIELGMSADDLAELREHLADPRVVLLGNLTWSMIGRKPTAED